MYKQTQVVNCQIKRRNFNKLSLNRQSEEDKLVQNDQTT